MRLHLVCTPKERIIASKVRCRGNAIPSTYAMSRNKLLCIDMGHFHPSELVADKISSILLFVPELLLHISRPMRWDSDHVVLFNDDLRILAEELVRSGRINDVYLGLDFFDASINRIGAWAVGSRSTLKGLLAALLQPADTLLAISETATSSREWLS